MQKENLHMKNCKQDMVREQGLRPTPHPHVYKRKLPILFWCC
jgi:hypothetical protein